jgi:beta-galactosidase
MYLARHFRALVGQGVRVDMVFEGEDFSKYRLLVLPALAVMEPALAERLRRFVAEGGVLVLWPWCGVMDKNAKSRYALYSPDNYQ